MRPLRQVRADRETTGSDHGGLSRRALRPRLVLAGMAVVVVLLAPSGAAADHRGTSRTVAAVTSLLAGIPQENDTLGDPHAPVTLVMFGDLECPTCRYVSLHTLPTLIKKFVRPGKLNIEYHSFQSATPEPAVFHEQQVAALAAGEQNKMWYFVELFYHEQGREYSNYVNESYLDGLARQVPGLNFSAWMTARSDPELLAQVERDEQIGEGYGWETTPDFFLSEGARLRPFFPMSARPSSFAAAIRQRLRDR